MIMANTKLAMTSIRRARWRSVLTMMGVIVGVASVVTAVSLGVGVKRQVQGQINKLGPDIVTITPGNIAGSSLGLAGSGLTATFSEADLQTVQNTPGLAQVTAFAVVPSQAQFEGRNYEGPIIAVSGDVAKVLGQDLLYGTSLGSADSSKDSVVIGKRVAEQLFGENVPIGKAVTIRGQSFRVSGIFDEFDTSPLTPGPDYNSTIFIGYSTAKQLNNAPLPIYQILVKPTDAKQTEQAAIAITKSLKAAHGGQQDFRVLKQAETLAASGKVLNILTALVTSIAAISLLVGGVGIMNIMLLAVTERIHEIGLRKAVGATNKQIMGQFLTEAALLSVMGGIIGVLLALLANYFLRIFTDLKPVVTWQISLIAVGVALAVGMVFGSLPAFKAARKDPIDALRHE